MSDLSKLLGPIARRITNMIVRGVVSSVNSTSKMQTLQLRLMAGESKDRVEHFEPFGFTSKPLPGAEHVTVFLDGDRSHGVTLIVADRRYRKLALNDGETAVHDAYGNCVHFKKDGTLAVVASTQVQITSPLVTFSGNAQISGNLQVAGTTTTVNLVATGTTNTGGLAASGSVAVTGNVTATGTVTGATDVVGGGKSLKSHTHSGVVLGGGNTGPPN